MTLFDVSGIRLYKIGLMTLDMIKSDMVAYDEKYGGTEVIFYKAELAWDYMGIFVKTELDDYEYCVVYGVTPAGG